MAIPNTLLRRFPVNQLGLVYGILTATLIALSGQFTQRYWPLPLNLVMSIRVVGWTCAVLGFFALLNQVRAGFTLSLQRVLLVSALLATPFFLTHPILAGDLYAYIASVKVGALGNPYVLTPAALGSDPIRAGIFELWQHWPMTYGPLWGLLVKGLSIVTTNTLVLLMVFRLIGLLAVLWTSWMVGRATSAGRAALFAWSPLVLVEVVGDGHNDILVGLSLLLAVIFAQRPVRSALSFAVSVALKYVPIITLLAFIAAVPSGRRVRRAVLLMSVTVAGFVLCLAPFWAGTKTFVGFQEQASLFTLPVFFPQFLIFLFAFFHPTSLHPEAFARAVGLAAFCVAWVTILRFAWRGKIGLPATVTLTLAAYLVLAASYVQTWYVLWLLPLVLLLKTRHALRWTAVISITWAAMQLVHAPL